MNCTLGRLVSIYISKCRADLNWTKFRKTNRFPFCTAGVGCLYSITSYYFIAAHFSPVKLMCVAHLTATTPINLEGLTITPAFLSISADDSINNWHSVTHKMHYWRHNSAYKPFYLHAHVQFGHKLPNNLRRQVNYNEQQLCYRDDNHTNNHDRSVYYSVNKIQPINVRRQEWETERERQRRPQPEVLMSTHEESQNVYGRQEWIYLPTAVHHQTNKQTNKRYMLW